MQAAPSDGDLLRQIAAGGEAGALAETELCRRFSPRIRLYGLKHLRSEDRAKDLVQAVLLGVLSAARAGRVSDPDRAERFILGTCRNVSIRMREGDDKAVPTPAEELALFPHVEPERVDTRALIGCLAALDERSRRVVWLTYHEERSAEEVGEALETTAGNVRVLRHRAIASLRRCLDGKAER